jgi:hypothetical protein
MSAEVDILSDPDWFYVPGYMSTLYYTYDHRKFTFYTHSSTL